MTGSGKLPNAVEQSGQCTATRPTAGPTVRNISDGDEGFFVYGTIQGFPIALLLDTGACVSITKKTFFDHWPAENKPEVFPVKI